MSKINDIQSKIKELDAGSFQKLFDEYLYRKYKFTNIHTLGMQDGTNKTTKGIPDSYVLDNDGTYILLMYGTRDSGTYSKIKDDIMSCVNSDKLSIDVKKIKRIICAHSASNLRIEQLEELKKMIPGVYIEIIDLSTISYDLLVNYPSLANDYLNITVDTHQIFTIKEFIKTYDSSKTNAPLAMEFYFRGKEMDQLYNLIGTSNFIIVTGKAGIGKTRFVIEVCKKLEQEGWEVLCAKNNGLSLYDDVRVYISDPGQYLLFIDDVNLTTTLESILDYVTSLPDNITVKMIMTVRDYAKSRVYSTIMKYGDPGRLLLAPLKDSEIKDILKNNLDIQNIDYLNQIVKIAKGNVRLAILSGGIAKEKGYIAISNVTDIYEHYYGEIIKDDNLSETEVDVLFIVSLLISVRFKESIIAKSLAEIMNITSEQFLDLCYMLNEKELLDLYEDTVVKINDQSLGNYILYYVLIEKKWISISDILNSGFPQYKHKLVYAIRTLLELFYSENGKKYITDQINNSWNKANENTQKEYIKTFFAFNEEKTLNLIKHIIDEDNGSDTNIFTLDFEKEKRHNIIKNDEIDILSQFKYSNYFDDALELLLLYYEKRPDLIMDCYFALSDRMSFDVNSHKFDYKKEIQIINCLLEHADEGQNTNVTILMLYVFKEFLKCSFQSTEPGDNDRAFTLYEFNVLFTDGSKKLRHTIWEALSKLYGNVIYESLVKSIIAEDYTNGLGLKESKDFYLYDLQCIKEMFFDQWEQLSFDQCKILTKLKKRSEYLGITDEQINKKLFDRCMENKDFMIYSTFVDVDILEEGHEEKLELKIKELVRNYTLQDYDHLFKIFQMCEKDNDKNGWMLKSGIEAVFSSIDCESNLYYDVLKLYLKNQAPYGDNPQKIVCTMLDAYGFEKTKMAIQEEDFALKHNWISSIWANIPEEMLDNTLTNEFLVFIKYEATLEKPNFPSIACLNKYKVFDEDIVKKVSEIIIQSAPKDSSCISRFLGIVMNAQLIDLIKDLYADNWSLLEELYKMAVNGYFDHDGELLMILIKKRRSFWDEFTKVLPESIKHETDYERHVFDKIWGMSNYREFINIAYKNILEDSYNFWKEREEAAIFALGKNTSAIIEERKKQWIKEYIDRNFNDTIKIKKIFEIIVNYFESDKKDFILYLLENSRDINLFESIPLFPYSESWTGSEVPLIDDKINFVDDLMASLVGYNFIEHREYLRNMKDSLEQTRKDIVIREYIEEEDIA